MSLSCLVKVSVKVFVFVSVFVSVGVILTSCDYKDLCYDHSHWASVRIAFDWSQEEDADPKGMTTLFYDQTTPGAEAVRYDLAGKDGGIVRLLPGTWRAIAYNYDTETILYRGMETMGTIEAYTRVSSIEEGTQLSRSGMPRVPETEQEPVILEPDPLWSCFSDPFTLTMDAPTSDASRTSRAGDTNGQAALTLQPANRFCELTVTIHNVPNLQYTGQFGGALSGLAPSVWLQSGLLGDGRATQAFTCQVVDASTLQMHCRIFGHCPHRDEGIIHPHLLTIYAILADGQKWYYTQDVTDQMHNKVQNPDDYHIYIELDGLPVPKPIVNGSGFHPTVDGWQGEEIDVTM